ncbi:MAG: IS1595 family transposase [SAR202 cluster bacterium]|nr:IS1595 family transposase [SAR202 cluster bacterium]
MSRKLKCPRCGHPRAWKVRRDKLRCAACRYEWTPKPLPLGLTVAEWRRLLRWFVLGHTAMTVARETRLKRKKVLKSLLLVREAMIKDIPTALSGDVEVDVTYLGGKRRAGRRREQSQNAPPHKGSARQPILGILRRGGQVWATPVPDVRAGTLLPLLHKLVKQGSVVYTDSFRAHSGLPLRGSARDLVDAPPGFADAKGGHVNSLKSFWGYLKRRLSNKGGIRRERLPLYIGESIWRYNNRGLSIPEQVKNCCV